MPFAGKSKKTFTFVCIGFKFCSMKAAAITVRLALPAVMTAAGFRSANTAGNCVAAVLATALLNAQANWPEIVLAMGVSTHIQGRMLCKI
jgi:hypothetical protein